MRLNALLTLFISSLLACPGLAATISVAAGGDVAGAVGSANPGDIVLLGAGTFTVNAPITIPSGITLTGVSSASSHLVFNLATTDATLYAMYIAANASNVTITDLDLVSNHGIIAMGTGSGYSNITISHNNIQTGGGQSSAGILVFGISGTINNANLNIVSNYFHDSPSTARNWTVWFATNSHFDNNLFYNINDGGQICSPGPNVTFDNNYGTYIHRMGQEVSLQVSSTFTCSGNVFYNYISPYYDTEGVSIVGPSGAVTISNNYFDANFAPGSSWGQADSGGTNRFGYAIEATGSPCNVTSNTLVGTWAEDVCSDIANANVSNNSVYGSGLWGDFEGEPGPNGYGSIITANNLIDTNISDAPAAPADTFAGVNSNGSTTSSAGGSSGSSGSSSGSSGSSGSSSGSSGSSGSNSGGSNSGDPGSGGSNHGGFGSGGQRFGHGHGDGDSGGNGGGGFGGNH
jgi:hypothetical protein